MKHPLYYIGIATLIVFISLGARPILLTEWHNPSLWLSAMALAGLSLISISTALLRNTIRLRTTTTISNI